MKITTGQAVRQLIKALKEDEGYYIGWKSNIAMAFSDGFWRNIKSHQDLDLMNESTLLEIANLSADNFLKQLIG